MFFFYLNMFGVIENDLVFEFLMFVGMYKN